MSSPMCILPDRWCQGEVSVTTTHVLCHTQDTFAFAFALAAKLHEVYAVAVPPAAAFVHQAKSKKVSASGERGLLCHGNAECIQ